MAMEKNKWVASGLLLGGWFVWALLAESVVSEVEPFGLLFMIIVGAQGNQWREKNLLTRGYECEETVQAQTPEAALALWVKEASGEK